MSKHRLNIDEDAAGALAIFKPGQTHRRQAVAEYVINRGSVTVEELVAVAGVSQMTVYRDISALAAAGLIERRRGKVYAVANSLQEAGAKFRLGENVDYKKSIAKHVASKIPGGSSIMIDDSTSAVWVLRELEDVPSLTVVTNSMIIANEVAATTGTSLYLTGGEYQPWAQALLGSQATVTLESMRVDFSILSSSGISGQYCVHPYQELADVKSAMLKSSETKILILDHTKFSRRGLHTFAKVSDFDLIVVDDQTPTEMIDRLIDYGGNVEIAGS